MKQNHHFFIRIVVILSLILLPTAMAFAEAVTIGVKGMVCAFCAQSLKKKFSAEPAVSEVDVNLDLKRVSLKLKPEPKLSDESIKRIINDAGYSVGEIKRVP